MGLVLDGKCVHVDGEKCRLHPLEARLLQRLLKDAGEIVSYDALAGVWGYEACDSSLRATIQVHVCRLRRVVGRWRIRNISGEGYKIVD